MESNQVEMYQIANAEPSDDKDKVVLRALVGNPNKHKPLAQHSPLIVTTTPDKPPPASMYTLESRNRPIPERVLPKTAQTKVYYLEPQETQAPPASNDQKIEENQTQLMPSETVAPIIEQSEPEPIAFLEPQIISEPVLYSIVDGKSTPVYIDQTIPTKEDVPAPILYAITGHSRPPPIDMNATATKTPATTTHNAPYLYSLVGSPNMPKQPEKLIPKISQQSSANFYTIVGHPSIPREYQQPIKPITKVSQQPSPTLYSVVGSPTLTLPIIEQDTPDASPPTEPVTHKSLQPAPIIYTIVDNKQMPSETLKENNLILPVPVKKQINDPILYGVVGDPKMPTSMTIPVKNQLLPPIKQKAPPQQQHSEVPMLYASVGQPVSATLQDMTAKPKKSLIKETPISFEGHPKQVNHSLERRTEAEPLLGKIPPIANAKQKREAKSQERIIPKSETIFIPLREREPLPRPKRLRTTPGKIRHKDFLIPDYNAMHASNYISPYAYHPSKTYRERTCNPRLLPPLKNSSERKSRVPIYESNYRCERKHPYDPWTAHSLERYPVDTKRRSRLWDFDQRAQTDTDDDDNDEEFNRRKQLYRRIRVRTPWIPVW
ncbi:unnamed protein product [Rotaria magnacalcarata]|uniref:Uncharacterized protein n=2 Tax=Rotaria magnacalcarata TaxID=392030 RepID=A0A816ZDQ5_9BILA|nr:unnamed protein product [Rotaria magnacalcarata]CAF4498512.1 unnamed protein product [Rotaria magnacalcarata]